MNRNFRKDVYILLASIIIGILIYFIPGTRRHPTFFLLSIATLALIATAQAVYSSHRSVHKFLLLKPALFNVLFFLPLVLIEWIYLNEQGVVQTAIWISVDTYEHYSVMPLYGALVTLSFGVAGAGILYLRQRQILA